MDVRYFFGGAILGAAGLTAAALIDDKLNPKPSLPAPDEVRSMSVERVTSGLSAYCMKASALNSKTLDPTLNPWNNVTPLMDYEGDSLLDRIKNRMGGAICIIDRKIKMSALRNFLEESERLFKLHRCLFVRANIILREHGVQGINLKTLTPRKRAFMLDSSVSNGDWMNQYSDSLQVVQDFITATIDMANLLCEKLEALSEPEKANTLPNVPTPATA